MGHGAAWFAAVFREPIRVLSPRSFHRKISFNAPTSRSHSASVPMEMRRRSEMRGLSNQRTMIALSRNALKMSAAVWAGWRAKMKLALDGQHVEAEPHQVRRQPLAAGDHFRAAFLEPGLVLVGGDGAGLGEAVERIGVETVLHALQRVDQVARPDGDADAQTGQRAGFRQRVRDQQVGIAAISGIALSAPKST